LVHHAAPATAAAPTAIRLPATTAPVVDVLSGGIAPNVDVDHILGSIEDLQADSLPLCAGLAQQRDPYPCATCTQEGGCCNDCLAESPAVREALVNEPRSGPNGKPTRKSKINLCTHSNCVNFKLKDFQRCTKHIKLDREKQRGTRGKQRRKDGSLCCPVCGHK